MKSFTLEIDELAAVVGFLNATKLVGMDEKLFSAFSEENLARLMDKLKKNGWLTPGERPETWHINTDLMQTVAVAVAPQFAVLARSKAQPKSIVFYVAKSDVVEIVVTGERAVVAKLADTDELGSQAMKFLSPALPGEILVARVAGERFDAGHQAIIDERGTMSTNTPGLLPGGENAFNAENASSFVRNAMADLGAGPR